MCTCGGQQWGAGLHHAAAVRHMVERELREYQVVAAGGELSGGRALQQVGADGGHPLALASVGNFLGHDLDHAGGRIDADAGGKAVEQREGELTGAAA